MKVRLIMKALVKTAPGKGNLELRDVPVPDIGDEDVLMKVTRCGICGSDLHRESGVYPCPTPIILGHEYTGIVAKSGKEVNQFREGDLVSYRRGFSPWPGGAGDGGMAEYMRVPAHTLWKTPEGITQEEASQFETVIVPFALVRDVVRIQPGERVVISGPGPVGLLTTNVARIEGAGHITVLGGPDDEILRLPKALEMGAEEVMPFGPEALEKIKGENAPPVWFEASGAAAAIEASVECIANNGRISISGMGSGPWNVNMWRVAKSSIKILGKWGGNGNYMDDAVELIRSGKLKMSAIIEVMPITKWKEAFRMLRRKEAIKILLDPSG
jgi:alcohol dehydrogenase/L-iditol 2-dehydrogenase